MWVLSSWVTIEKFKKVEAEVEQLADKERAASFKEEFKELA